MRRRCTASLMIARKLGHSADHRGKGHERRFGFFCDDVGQCGFPRPGWAPQNQRRDPVVFNGLPERLIPGEHVVLADKFVERLGTKPLG